MLAGRCERKATPLKNCRPGACGLGWEAVPQCRIAVYAGK